jgi:hypothetical protein
MLSHSKKLSHILAHFNAHLVCCSCYKGDLQITHFQLQYIITSWTIQIILHSLAFFKLSLIHLRFHIFSSLTISLPNTHTHTHTHTNTHTHTYTITLHTFYHTLLKCLSLFIPYSHILENSLSL